MLVGCPSSDEHVMEDLINQSFRSPASFVSTDSTQLMLLDLTSYTIRKGDVLHLSIREYPEFDTTVTVGDMGTIFVRWVGEIPVAGLTRAQSTDELIRRLSAYLKADITPEIIIVKAFALQVAVMGAVARQDLYTFPTEVSLLQVLTAAGGTSGDADLQHIKIIRSRNESGTTEVNLTKYIEQGDVWNVPSVQPGDIVFVPREVNMIRELAGYFRDVLFIFSVFAVTQ